ncbi:MAG: hypothetical protein K2X26_11090 [Chitinophagaceae bacterium]|jgi:predicted ABC-type ATPase|nr:hypothetical protein [Chitinophagaceae bacterium]MCA6439318.1 hypothetical protein [Chitinophagaceae bacterium]MCA6448114.1 hypothetical protein [Chitinophagaceae bacterium]
MPTLYILGGANGSGKTTWYNFQAETGNIDPTIPFINIDNIVLQELGSYNQKNLALGEEIARERISNLIDKHESFMIESNLSKATDYEWIERMEQHGYETILYFLGTQRVEINKDRVLNRVVEGGHDVAPSIIEQRYSMGLTYLKSKVLAFTEAYLYDSSSAIPKQMALLKKGVIVQKVVDLPVWASEILFIANKLHERKQLESRAKDSKKDDVQAIKKKRNNLKRKGRHL